MKNPFRFLPCLAFLILLSYQFCNLSPVATAKSGQNQTGRTFDIDSRLSRVEFTVHRGKHIGAVGSFSGLKGTIKYNGKSLAKSRVSATIPLNTINTAVNVRDTDLIGPKYFDCGRFPNAKFDSTSLSASRGKYTLVGTFSLHGVKRPVRVILKGLPYVRSESGKSVFKVVGTATLSQEDYGLSLLKLHPDGAVRINKNIEIKVTIIATAPAK